MGTMVTHSTSLSGLRSDRHGLAAIRAVVHDPQALCSLILELTIAFGKVARSGPVDLTSRGG